MPREKTKERLDRLLVERGLANSRQEAQGLIMAGKVMVGGARSDKCGSLFQADSEIVVTGVVRKYVSRGGLKLEAALDGFGIDCGGRSAIDVGASTGGFTDCLLSRGVERVICVDVGYGQLAEKLRTDPRVTVLDRFNARNITRGDLPFACCLAVVDVAFISLKLILPPLMSSLEPGSDVVALVKPQFEAGKEKVGKGGIVRDATVREAAVHGVEQAAANAGYVLMGRMTSPTTGADGNVEFLLHLRTPGDHGARTPE
jgi:23S rRNA (cytidine1920-2'-O)/16S rRNA (cytidine1409-2'-O)-methyltransferase